MDGRDRCATGRDGVRMAEELTGDKARVRFWRRAKLFHLAAVSAAVLLAVPAVSISRNQTGGTKSGSTTSAKSKSAAKPSKGSKSSSPAKKTAPCGKATWHKVAAGDTLWELANRYKTTVSALERMNGKKAKNLKPGVSLMVKPAKPCPKPKQVPKPKELPKPAESAPEAVKDPVPVPEPEPAPAPVPVPDPAPVPVPDPVPDPVPVPVPVPVPDPVGAFSSARTIDDEYESGGAPAVNLPSQITGASIDGLHPDEELTLYDEAVEMGGDDLPMLADSPEDGAQADDSREVDGDLYPSDDDGEIADDEIASDEKDPYSGDGVPDDLVELPDFPEFGFKDDGAECAYYLDAMSPMPKNPKGTVNIYYKVRKGDNLTKIAKKYKTTVRNLENLNRIRGNKKKAQRLMHPGKMVLVRLGDPRDLLEARPFLADWVQLTTQKGYNIKRPSASYGRPWAMKLMLRAMCEFRRRNPGAGNIVVGDWSGKVGGQLGRHLSHRTGRDVDLSYFIEGKPGLKGFVRATPSSMDVGLSWELVRALLDTRQVEFIFMDWSLQKAMYEYARSKGFPEAELNQIFQYPEGRRVRSGIIRWARGHDNHIHVRFKCPGDDKLCR